ncbi:hypothetical protein H0274_13180 [Altererythrobacter sp. CC-YST694]|uniref:hypothetical protein n=1 Tax=Altererythrobacter sp. CC-YST694 TaxID=2755038 RepID=UPI001D01B494|nr:hypothetical protein [Altererythrobacter sp. CC-YST694]MCB5426214.1 hypothetical protein [Altererythrobacter sp. CC-YST694]
MSDDPARGRYFTISMIRLAGVAMVLVGALVVRQIIEWPKMAGYVLIAAGLIDVYIVPQILARKWRTPK